ncbi:hypothetical protein BRETT_001057 [Brettanomyces bruxellensis]|uniref:Peptidase S54 rhomboid domain-containing protein n=1 Tax=Dekkera bruxellensis TaxID=5007 RepID=A0A871RAZ0_DEKBR|nr:uncharacterized protein BRETT_001057 [Brettanomyces bruxellensis]QOU21335.1 hypothetical protein BRETT_001057 [Brettanomyces bruxellensis]
MFGLGLRFIKPSASFKTFHRDIFNCSLFSSKSRTLYPTRTFQTQTHIVQQFRLYFKSQRRKYATYSELGYYPGRMGGSGEGPHFNNVKNNVVKPILYTIAFSAVTYFAMPYIFDNTPMKYFKTHKKYYLYGLIGLNVAVFGLWQLRFNGGRIYSFLEKYFLLDRSSLTRKSNVSMILSTFSHQEFFHLFVNMLCLYSFAISMVNIMGVSQFSSLYLISGCASSLASIIFSFVTKSYGCSLGASGAISAIFAAFTAIFPTANVALFIIPIPGGASTALALFTAYNVGGCIFRWSTFDFAAHLGGTIVGYLWGMQYKKKIKAKYRHLRSYW